MPSKAKHLLAAERALGHAPIGLETKAEAKLRRDWELRLAPLGLAIREEVPPEDMLLRIMRTLDRSDDRVALTRAKRGMSKWRWATLAATALAAGLAYLAITPMLEKPVEPVPSASRYVAVVTPQNSKASLIVEVDPENKTALVRPIGLTAEAGKSLEMWRIEPLSDPESVGLVAPDKTEKHTIEVNPGDIIAISLEPEGGSPTGAPTGEFLFGGALVEVPE